MVELESEGAKFDCALYLGRLVDNFKPIIVSQPKLLYRDVPVKIKWRKKKYCKPLRAPIGENCGVNKTSEQ